MMGEQVQLQTVILCLPDSTEALVPSTLSSSSRISMYPLSTSRVNVGAPEAEILVGGDRARDSRDRTRSGTGPREPTRQAHKI